MQMELSNIELKFKEYGVHLYKPCSRIMELKNMFPIMYWSK